MASLVKVWSMCESAGCPAPATRELFDKDDHRLGQYCIVHAVGALLVVQQREEQEAKGN